ncbi:hypothetical protein BGZ51_003857 [Haplosporangium sp. Z 767]|nr:hypothetical protein BGZ50_005238 [Haplosporangium sp. Z 11]KAF9183680.1 hypothetical protein BGZ51_003857 [Haplosporangium sp. Z 767]
MTSLDQDDQDPERGTRRDATQETDVQTPKTHFKAQRTGRTRDSLGWIGGVWERTHYGDDDMGYDEDSENDIAADTDKLETDENWTVQKLYQGLVTVTLTTVWVTLFGTSRVTARYMAGCFTRALEDFGCDVIWNRRCEITAEWERSMGITTMSKRAKGRTGVEGHLRSGGDLFDLNLGLGLVANGIWIGTQANARVMNHFEEKEELDVMESTGEFKFLSADVFD